MSFSNLNVRNNNKYFECLSAQRLCNRVRAAGAAPRVPLARRGGASDVPRDRAAPPPPRLAPRYVIFPHALFRTIDLYRFGRKKNVETCLKKVEDMEKYTYTVYKKQNFIRRNRHAGKLRYRY